MEYLYSLENEDIDELGYHSSLVAAPALIVSLGKSYNLLESDGYQCLNLLLGTAGRLPVMAMKASSRVGSTVFMVLMLRS